MRTASAWWAMSFPVVGGIKGGTEVRPEDYLGKYTVYGSANGLFLWVQHNESIDNQNQQITVRGATCLGSNNEVLISWWDYSDRDYYRHYDSAEELLKAYPNNGAVLKILTS